MPLGDVNVYSVGNNTYSFHGTAMALSTSTFGAGDVQANTANKRGYWGSNWFNFAGIANVYIDVAIPLSI